MLRASDSPQTHHEALLLVDLIHPFEFPEAELLLQQTRRVIDNVVALRQCCRAQQVPVVYVNDNFGNWRSSFEETTAVCSEKLGGDIVRAVTPTTQDYFVLKPQRSGFFHTPLHLLLRELNVSRVVLAGITTDMCVLATANDARMRGYDVWLAGDCAAAIDPLRHEKALEVLGAGLQVTIRDGHQIQALLQSSSDEWPL